MKIAFLVMSFGQTSAHDKIVRAIRKGFEEHSITVLRAGDKAYHDNLFPYIQPYMYG